MLTHDSVAARGVGGLVLEELRAELARRRLETCGHLDQIAALEWVSATIAWGAQGSIVSR